jgi:signal transduction histidine kinase
MRSNLISNITHELKTPISTVNVALEALQSFKADNDSARRQEYLGIAQSEIQRLAMLVDKVLTTSGLGNSDFKLKIEKFDLNELVKQVLDTLKFQFGKISAKVNMHTSGEDFMIEADKLHITGVIHNLMDNALKYGGQHPVIDLNLSQQNGKITIIVTDHGLGIPVEYQDKIFDKFFRVPSGNTHNIKGHGLGLSYVAEVVREHGGTIHVKSAAGKGSTFTVILPRQHAN